MELDKVKIVLNRRAFCQSMQVTKVDEDTNQDGKPEKSTTTIDVKEIIGCAALGIMAVIFAIKGEYELALAIGGPLGGYTLGRST